MPIGFARMQVLSRGSGHDARQRYRYIARLSEYAYRRDIARVPVTLLPAIAPAALTGAKLWSEVKKRARRKDSVVGAELVLSLPLFSEFSLAAADDLVADFCRGMIVEFGFGATYAIHGVHDEKDALLDAKMATENVGAPSVKELIDTISSWPHAHVLFTPKLLSSEGLESKRCTLLEPLIRGQGKSQTVLCAVPWHKIWTRYLNSGLLRSGSDLRVRLKAPHGGMHIGPSKALPLLQRDAAQADIGDEQMWPRLNSQIEARNVVTLKTAPELSEVVFTRSEVADLLSRYLGLSGHAHVLQTDLFMQEVAAVPLTDPVSNQSTPFFVTKNTLDQARSIKDQARKMGAQRAKASTTREALNELVEHLELRTELLPAVADLLATGRNIVTIETGDLGSVLLPLNEIISCARARPVHIGHQSITLAPLGRSGAKVLIPSMVEKKLEAGSVVLLDRPDSLPLRELDVLLKTLNERGCQVLLIRRPHTLAFPRNVVVDRVCDCGPKHYLSETEWEVSEPRIAPVDKELSALVAILRSAHVRSFPDRVSLLEFARRVATHPI